MYDDRPSYYQRLRLSRFYRERVKRLPPSKYEQHRRRDYRRESHDRIRYVRPSNVSFKFKRRPQEHFNEKRRSARISSSSRRHSSSPKRRSSSRRRRSSSKSRSSPRRGDKRRTVSPRDKRRTVSPHEYRSSKTSRKKMHDTSSRRSKNETTSKTKEKPKKSSPSKTNSPYLPTPEELLPSLSNVADNNIPPVIETKEKRQYRRLMILKRRIRKLLAQRKRLTQPKLQVMCCNFEIESRFAETLTSFMSGRRFVISQRQVCTLANRLASDYHCSDEYRLPLAESENSSLNFEWLKKFCLRHRRVAQFIDGINGNWFWRKSRLTNQQLDECFALCKRCLK